MKRLTTVLALVPGAALAHGGHVELQGPAHDTFHAAPILGLAVIAVALVAAALGRVRR